METIAQDEFQKFKETDKKYIALEKAANEEIERNNQEVAISETTNLEKEGYSGKATFEDWIKFFKENGGAEIFGNNIENLAKEMMGNIDEFNNWYKKYHIK